MWKVLLLCALIVAASATGTLHCDEICGLTDIPVHIPSVVTDHSVSVFLEIQQFEASFEEGFQLSTVGGVSINAENGLSFSTPGTLDLIAAVSGGVVLRAQQTDINADGYISFWAQNEGIIDTKEDIVFKVDPDFDEGTINFNSDFGTHVSAALGMVLSASEGEVRVVAGEGVVKFKADQIGITSGNNDEDTFDLISGDLFVIAADREFNILTQQNVNVTADSKVTFNSKYNDIRFESDDTFNLYGNSNVILSASAGYTLETLLGDISLDSDEAASIYGRQLRTQATTTSFSADELLNYESSGNINFLAVNDVAFTTRFNANHQTGDLFITGRTNGEVRVDINALLATASNIKVRAADTRLSGINFEASNLEFITKTADIVMTTNFWRAQAPVVNITATHDAILAATGFHFVDPSSNYEDGALTWVTVTDTLFDAKESLTILSDQSELLFSDSVSIKVTVGNTLTQGSAQFSNYNADTITLTTKNVLSFTSTDAGFYSQSAGDQIYTVASDFSATGVVNNNLYVTENIDILASAVTTNTAVGSFLLYANGQGSVHAGGKITVTDNAHDHQTTNVNVGHIIALTGGSVDIDSETEELSFKVPSGGANFDAGNNIAFNLGYGYFTSVGESITITGTTDYTAQTGLYFRAGDELRMTAQGGNLHFTSTSVEINSGADVSAQSDLLTILTTTSHFKGDNRVNFRSGSDFDFSPHERGDVEIHGGRIDFFSPDLFNVTANEITQSSGNGLDIEFNTGFGGSTLVTEQQGVSFDSDYFQLQAIETVDTSLISTFTSNETSVIISASSDDLIMRAFSQGATFTVEANTTVSYSGAAFIFESNNVNSALSFTAPTGEVDITASTRADFTNEGNIVWTVGGDLLWDGTNFELQFNENQQFTPSTFVSKNTHFTTCDGDWRSITDHYAMSGLSGGIFVNQNTNVCDTTGTPGNFLIFTDAVDLQAYTVTTATFSGTNDLQVTTGRAKFETGPSGTTLSVTSGTFIDINSKNTESYLFDEAHDYVYAGRDVLVTAATYIDLTSTGLAGYALSNQENLRGFEIDLNNGNLLVSSTQDAITFSALKQYIEFWTGDFAYLTNKNDLLVYGGEGRIQLTANGNIENLQANQTSGIEFWAPNGDLLVHTDLASISISSAKENYVQTLTGEIDFTAGYSISHSADQIGGVISYNTLLGSQYITADLNITLTAGTRELNSDITMIAARDVDIFTKFDQRYITTGPAPEGEASITLTAEEGAISISTSSNEQIYASGDALYRSATNQLTLTAKGDISLFSVAEVRINSTLTSTVTVTRGDISLDAGGGGGSVDIISDGAQSLTATAGLGISIKSEDTNQYHAQNGLSGITQQGSVIFKQTGDYQLTNFHSDGSILLQAAREDGILLSGLSTTIEALRDVTFDATQTWSVGSTSLDSTATQPRIAFHGGGDYGIVGINFDITGGMSWETTKIGPVTFDANRAIWTTVGDIDFLANGPVYFINKGEFNDAVFTMTSGGLLTLNAGAAVEFKSNATSSLTVPNHISLSSSGGLPLDTSFIRAQNNWKIDTPTLTTTTNVLEAELRDMYVSVDGQITITNTPGDGGSLKIQSDWWFIEKSVGPTLLSSQGITTILTEAPYSDIIFDSAADFNFISGGSISAESSGTSLAAPHGISFVSEGGDIELVASDDVIIASNDTMTFTGYDSVTIQSGFTNTGGGLLSSPVNISSRGDLTVQSQNDMVIQTLGATDDLRIVADVDLLIQNRLPGKSSDQGDIRITSPGSGYQFAGSDFNINAGRDIYIQADTGIFASIGDLTMTATASQASIDIQGEQLISFNAYNELVLAATTSLTFTATDDLIWNQVNEEGVGGIVIGSDSGRTTVNGPRGITFTAQNSIEGSAPYYLFSADRSLLVKSSPFGGDILYKSASSIVFDVTEDFTIGSSDDTLTNTIKIISDPSAGGASSITFTTPTTMSVQTDNHQITYLGNQMALTNPNTTGSVQTHSADETLAIISLGVAPDTRFGIRIESDESQIFTASDDLAMNANLGQIIMVASEDFTLDATSDIYVSSGNNVLISTGFTVEPNFSLLYRRGILFDSVGESSYRSNKGSVNFYGEDSSWTVNSQIIMRSRGDGFFGSRVSNAQWTGSSVTTLSNAAYYHSENDVSITGRNLLMQSRGSTIFYSDDSRYTATNSLTLQGEEGILFTTPKGAVDFGSVDGQVFRIPRLQKEAGISGHRYNLAYDTIAPSIATGDIYRVQEENEYPICKERSFGWDTWTNAFCYCDFNKWRCIDSL